MRSEASNCGAEAVAFAETVGADETSQVASSYASASPHSSSSLLHAPHEERPWELLLIAQDLHHEVVAGDICRFNMPGFAGNTADSASFRAKDRNDHCNDRVALPACPAVVASIATSATALSCVDESSGVNIAEEVEVLTSLGLSVVDLLGASPRAASPADESLTDEAEESLTDEADESFTDVVVESLTDEADETAGLFAANGVRATGHLAQGRSPKLMACVFSVYCHPNDCSSAMAICFHPNDCSSAMKAHFPNDCSSAISVVDAAGACCNCCFRPSEWSSVSAVCCHPNDCSSAMAICFLPNDCLCAMQAIPLR